MRSLGTLIIGEGVIIRAEPATEDRTDIQVAPDTIVGAIVHDSETGRWRYDETMRMALGITENPDFATDAEAGKKLREFLPPLSQINALTRPDHKGKA